MTDTVMTDSALTPMASLEGWLSEHGFEPTNLEQRGSNGDTPLMKAVQEEAVEVVRSLLQSSIPVNARNNDGNNALWFACFRDRVDLIHMLVEAHIDLNNQNDNGATALMYAASAGKAPIVEALLAAGADASLKNLDDFRAIDMASTVETLRMLSHGSR